MAHKGLWLHLEQSYECMILYRTYAAAIFFRCHPYIWKVTEKAFHKNAKTCRAGFHKKPTKQDGTHMTIRSQITIPTSIFPTTHTIIPYSLFWNGCVYMCVVNSRIGLWGLWVGVCIEGSREYSVMGF